MLRLDGVGAWYGRRQVLFDVDLEVGDGEAVALIGANGAGKTTLLRTISGLLPRGAGEIWWDGTDITRASPEQVVRQGIAHVPERRHLFAGLSVEDNLRTARYSLGKKPDLEPAIELFPILGKRLRQAAGTLSGGEQQMCAIARALLSEPRLIMIDELSMGLAPAALDLILERLSTVVERGVALLIVEQDVDAALELTARGYVLEVGEIRMHAASRDLATDERVRDIYLGTA